MKFEDCKVGDVICEKTKMQNLSLQYGRIMRVCEGSIVVEWNYKEYSSPIMWDEDTSFSRVYESDLADYIVGEAAHLKLEEYAHDATRLEEEFARTQAKVIAELNDIAPKLRSIGDLCSTNERLDMLIRYSNKLLQFTDIAYWTSSSSNC